MDLAKRLHVRLTRALAEYHSINARMAQARSNPSEKGDQAMVKLSYLRKEALDNLRSVQAVYDACKLYPPLL